MKNKKERTFKFAKRSNCPKPVELSNFILSSGTNRLRRERESLSKTYTIKSSTESFIVGKRLSRSNRSNTSAVGEICSRDKQKKIGIYCTQTHGGMSKMETQRGNEMKMTKQENLSSEKHIHPLGVKYAEDVFKTE